MIESITPLLPLVLPLVIASIIAGFIAGLLGIGGGIVIVPILYAMLSRININNEIIMHMCVGTSLATIIPTSLSSMRAHFKRDNVNFDLVKKWGPWIASGALLGALLASTFKSVWLQGIFAVFITLIAINMLRPIPMHFADKPPIKPWVIAFQGLFIGVFSALVGIGGGSLSVPLMTGYNVNTKIAVGTASVFGFLIALPGAFGFLLAGIDVAGRPSMSLGYIWLLALIIIVPITVLMAPMGARVASSIDATLLRRIFAIFLLIAGVKMGYSTIY